MGLAVCLHRRTGDGVRHEEVSAERKVRTVLLHGAERENHDGVPRHHVTDSGTGQFGKNS